MSIKIQEYFIDLFKSFRQYSEFKELEKYNTDTKNDKNEIIKFQVFLETNEYDEQYFNIVFNRDTNIEATCNFIKSNHTDNLLKIQNFIIYYFRGKRTTERDKKIINSKLKPKKEYQVEELIKKVSEKISIEVYDTERFITPPAFVFPKIEYFLKKKDNIKDSKIYNTFKSFKDNFLNKWFENKESSILVIKGQGGIGKTTIAKYFANYLLDENSHTSKIFIDSLEAKGFLLNEYHKNKSINIDLYELYKAVQNGGKTLDSLLFKNNLDAGNFFIIIDGIDELISKVKNFDINRFLNSIKNYYSIINNTKIIITCRSYFWNLDDSSKYNIESIEIKPFSLKQTESFFIKSFNNDTKKIEKALELANDFHKKREIKDNYHPYALDIISKIIQSNKSLISDNKTSFSKLLNSNETLDYIVDRICHRENYLQGKVRVLDLTVDEQVRVFKDIAVKFNGYISLDLLKTCISNSISSINKKNIPNTLVEAFKTHLLVSIDDNNILSFKYDFLTDFFKSIYIANYFNLHYGDENITEELIGLLRTATFGSSLTKEVPRRITNWGDDEFLKLSDIVGQIKKNDITDSEEIYSGIFNIAFYINKSIKSNNTIENTKLIENIFKNSGQIENLCLINVFDNKYKIKFNFSDQVLKDCVFDNYLDFWHCSFNDKVFFTNCTLLKLGTRLSKNQIPFDINNNVAKNCKFDDSFKESFNRNDFITEEYKEKITYFLKSFFRFFNRRGTIWSQNYIDDQGGEYTPLISAYANFGDINIEFKDFVSLMEKKEFAKVFFNKKFRVEQIAIEDKYKSDIIKYLEEGEHSIIITELNDLLYNFIRE